MPLPLNLCLALVFGSSRLTIGTDAVPLPSLSLPLFEAWVAPRGADIGAVLLSSVTCSAHALQVVDVVVWWVLWDDVVDCPVVAV